MGIYFIPFSLAASLYGVLVKDCGLNESQFAIILSTSGLGNVIGAAIYRNMNKQNNAKKNVLIYSPVIGAGFVTFGLAKSTSLTIESLYFSALIVGISMALMVIFILCGIFIIIMNVFNLFRMHKSSQRYSGCS